MRKWVITIALFLATIGANAQSSDEGLNIRTLPLWFVYLGTVLWVILAIRIGYWLGSKRPMPADGKPDTTITSVTGALMGLLAFILAFTFNLSMGRYDMRKQLYVEQVNAIETFYRKAEFLPEEYQKPIQAELIKLVDLRIGVIGHSEKIRDMIDQTYPIHDILWKLLYDLSNDTQIKNTIQVTITNSMTSLVEIHNKRTTYAVVYHLALPLWVTVYALVGFAMIGMGYLFGVGRSMNWTLVVILSLSFSSIVILISDLDRSGSNKSGIQFNQQSMVELRERLSKY